MVWSDDSTKANLQTLDQIETKLQNKTITVYAHSITRGGQASRVTVVPSPTPIYWSPDQPPPEDAKFNCESLGTWLPSGDVVDAMAGGKVLGLVRPAFEVASTSKAANVVSLNPNVARDSNPLHLLTNAKTCVSAGAYLALHES